MRKKWFSVVMLLVLTFGICGITLAADTRADATVEGFKSHGRITYQNGNNEVVIDSNDFYVLSDRLDLFKSGVADQLNVMNTYFTTGEGIPLTTDAEIRVTHTRPSDEELVDPSGADFNTLLEGIAASQSIPPDLAAASADNLSSGTAAWVNGELRLGTGEDNRSFYERGYEEGYAKVSSQIASVDFIKYGGDLRVYDEDWECSFLGPCDLYIPNKDVWVLLAGPISGNAEISPAPAARLKNSYLHMLQYPKDPNLSDTATRKLHVADSGSKTSGVAAPWYLLYLK